MSASNDKGKGKEVALPLPASSSGSANPAASLSSLWAYLLPALNHIVKSPTNNSDKAPAIETAFYIGIHTACYSYFTSQSETKSSARSSGEVASGTDLYDQLDRYYIDTAREIMLGAPQDDSTLIHYIVPCFNRFSAGAVSVNRLLNYVNRHYVKRAVDEDKGWLRLNDVLESVAKSITAEDSREKISERLKQKRIDELKKWGYKTDGSGEPMASAETCAEAASPPDRVITVAALAHRRFRTEVFEPLLAVPVVKGKKAKNKIPKAASTGPPIPKGRLARALKELLESKGGDEEERSRLVKDLSAALRLVGVVPTHPLRKRLDKWERDQVGKTS
ncbi:hypothetical protein FB45DRAFT_896732 [Roridomyces roridus]|uniref:Uncharacterized protein n=1 Tax=Roridomyces roridus TaxID=1738132 RepID=A0AAD7CAY3_9AGAR|nr:hypothetical protein FB45DRAFT_896732 [Roridomyces roridus]